MIGGGAHWIRGLLLRGRPMHRSLGQGPQPHQQELGMHQLQLLQQEQGLRQQQQLQQRSPNPLGREAGPMRRTLQWRAVPRQPQHPSPLRSPEQRQLLLPSP